MWYFEVMSNEYGFDKYGGYDTEVEAIEGQIRIKEKAKELDDDVERLYTDPYEEVNNA